MSFVCKKCKKTLSTKQRLEYHIKNNACKKTQFTCKHCGNGFTAATSMYKHMRENCLANNEKKEKEDIYNRLLKLEKDNKKLQMDNNELMKKITKIDLYPKEGFTERPTNFQINNGVINNTLNSTTNVILVGHGKEDISIIDKQDLINVLQNGFNSAIKLTEALHFNPKYPEYQNVYISNIKDKYAMMYDGKNWNLEIKENLINKIYDDKKNLIEENIDDFVNSLSESRKNALHRWLNTGEKDEKITQIKEKIKLLLYNKRKMIIDTRDKMI